MRTWNERNSNDWKKAVRKKKISDSIQQPMIFSNDGVPQYHPWYDNLHQYSKNKIHCSCPMCRCKTNNKKYKFYGPAKNPSLHDARQLIDTGEEIE